MSRRFYIAGFAFGLIGVILGAFATHGLKPILTPEAMDSFETGVRYQIYHAFLFLILARFETISAKAYLLLFYLLFFGILLFSGSIYLLSTNSLSQLDFKILGPVTPLGGSLLIFCWIILIVQAIKLKKK